MRNTKKIRFLEFLIIGVFMGVIEDMIAIVFATDAKVEWNVIFVVIIVAIPFAFLSEIVVDHPEFWNKIFNKKSIKK